MALMSGNELHYKMIEYVIEERCYYQISWYSTWNNFYKIMLSKMMIGPELGPCQLRKLFTNVILPKIEMYSLTPEQRAEMRHFQNVPNIEDTLQGYRLLEKPPRYDDNEFDIDILEPGSDFSNEPRSCLLIDSYVWEAFIKQIEIDPVSRCAVSKLLQGKNEKINNIEVPAKECLKRLHILKANFKKTGLLPDIFNDDNFMLLENASPLQHLIKLFTHSITNRVKNSAIPPNI